MGDVIRDKFAERHAARPLKEGGQRILALKEDNVVELPVHGKPLVPPVQHTPSADAPLLSYLELVDAHRQLVRENVRLLGQNADLLMSLQLKEERIQKLEAKLAQQSLPPLPPRSLWTRFLECFLGRSS